MSPAGTRGQRIWQWTRIHLRRASRCDFTREGATPEERALLSREPGAVHGARAQDYLAWRRSMAWVAFPALIIAVTADTIEFFKAANSEEQNLGGGLIFISFLHLATRFALLAAVVFAVRSWWRPHATRRVLRYGWLISFLGPMLLSLIPIVYLMEGSTEAQGVERLQWELVRIVVGLMFLMQLAPVFLALFPAITRAGLTIKTLLPGRSVAAAIAALMAPIYGGLFLLAGVVMQQIGGSVLLALGMIGIVIASLVVTQRGGVLVEPMTAERAGMEVAKTRMRSRIFLAIGGVLALASLFQTELLGKPLIGFGDDAIFGPLPLLGQIVAFVANVTVVTVVAADALVEGMFRAERRHRRYQQTEPFLKDEQPLREVASAVAFVGSEEPVAAGEAR
jgi:hypothetical protein